MENHTMHYETLIRVTGAISESKDPEEVALMTAESVKTAFKAKGCSIFMINRETEELELAASRGLSEEYLKKGPVNYLKSLKEIQESGPVAIYDVQDDPRIQYPEAAEKEGIASILGVPVVVRGKTIGSLRLYTDTPWEFSMMDINLVQAIAQICGMAMDMCRLQKGYKTSIEILKQMREPGAVGSSRWTPYEGVPKSVSRSICDY